MLLKASVNTKHEVLNYLTSANEIVIGFTLPSKNGQVAFGLECAY